MISSPNFVVQVQLDLTLSRWTCGIAAKGKTSIPSTRVIVEQLRDQDLPGNA